jgi:hypothetical protein
MVGPSEAVPPPLRAGGNRKKRGAAESCFSEAHPPAPGAGRNRKKRGADRSCFSEDYQVQRIGWLARSRQSLSAVPQNRDRCPKYSGLRIKPGFGAATLASHAGQPRRLTTQGHHPEPPLQGGRGDEDLLHSIRSRGCSNRKSTSRNRISSAARTKTVEGRPSVLSLRAA